MNIQKVLILGPLRTIKASYYHGKPATQKVLEHFCRSTPVVPSCDNPRCLSRLMIVPKRDPGAPKTSEPTSFRVTMNALINACLKPTPNLPSMRSRSSITGTSISRRTQRTLSGPSLLMTSLVELLPFKPMKASSRGTVSRWEPRPHLRFSSRHITALWIRICQPSGDIASHHTRTTSLPVPTPLRSFSRC